MAPPAAGDGRIGRPSPRCTSYSSHTLSDRFDGACHRSTSPAQCGRAAASPTRPPHFFRDTDRSRASRTSASAGRCGCSSPSASASRPVSQVAIAVSGRAGTGQHMAAATRSRQTTASRMHQRTHRAPDPLVGSIALGQCADLPDAGARANGLPAPARLQRPCCPCRAPHRPAFRSASLGTFNRTKGSQNGTRYVRLHDAPAA